MRLMRWIRIGLLGLLGLLLAGVWPVYLGFRKWNLGRGQQIAREALAAGDFSEARRRAQLILREDPTNYGMLKILHAAMVAQKDPKASDLVPLLARDPAGTAESRLDGFREVCVNLPLPSVFRNWLTLPDSDRKHPGFLQAFVNRLIEQGMPGDAEELLLQSPETARDPELQLLQARCWLGKGTAADMLRAQEKIADLMNDGGPTGLAAFRLLSQIPLEQFRSGYFLEIGPWLEQQPGATAADLLLGRIQPLDRFPAEESRIVAEAVNAFGTREPVACARWLRGLGRAREALALGAKVDAAGWAPTKADLLADLGLWSELEDWLSTAPAGLTTIDILTRRAIAAEKLGDPARSRSLWETILREAGAVKTSNVLLDVAAQTQAAGMEEMSREALLEAVRLKRGRLPFWDDLRPLLPWLREADRGDRLLVLCQVMTELDFTTPEPRLEALDLGYLLGRSDPADALGQLEQLVKNYPKVAADPRYHEVRATVLLGDGKSKDALEALNDSRQNIRPSSPRRTAVTAFAKAALASPPPSAEALREGIPWREMIREERDFCKNLLETRFAGQPAGEASPAGGR
jgi:tetratricopeptide (TPR) repeat protein